MTTDTCGIFLRLLLSYTFIKDRRHPASLAWEQFEVSTDANSGHQALALCRSHLEGSKFDTPVVQAAVQALICEKSRSLDLGAESPPVPDVA